MINFALQVLVAQRRCDIQDDLLKQLKTGLSFYVTWIISCFRDPTLFVLKNECNLCYLQMYLLFKDLKLLGPTTRSLHNPQ